MTTVAYKTLTDIEQVFKDLVWTPGIKSGELALEGAVPFLNIPVLRQLEEGVVDELSDWLFNNFVLLVDVAAIRLVNQAHQAAYTTASIHLMVLANDYGRESPEFKEARDVAKTDLSRFTQLGG